VSPSESFCDIFLREQGKAICQCHTLNQVTPGRDVGCILNACGFPRQPLGESSIPVILRVFGTGPGITLLISCRRGSREESRPTKDLYKPINADLSIINWISKI